MMLTDQQGHHKVMRMLVPPRDKELMERMERSESVSE